MDNTPIDDGEKGVATIRVSESLTFDCKNLKIVSDGMGWNTTVEIDGKPVAATRIEMSCDARGIWNVKITYHPAIGLFGECTSKAE